MSTPGRDDLTAALRGLVDSLKLSAAEVSRRTGMSEATVGRYIGSIQTSSLPKLSQVRKMVDALGMAHTPEGREAVQLAEDLNAANARVVLLRSGSATSQRRFQEIESGYTHIATFGALIVPGLLQTEAYMRVVFAAGGQSPEVVDRNVAGRLARQERLNDPGCRFTLLVAEGALRWQAESVTVMADQMDRLAEVAGRDTGGRVRVGVIPWTAAVDLFPRSSFDLYDDERAVIVGTDFGTAYLDKPRDVEVYVRQFRRLSELALFGDDARRVFERVAQEYRG